MSNIHKTEKQSALFRKHKFIVLLRLKEGCPHAILPRSTSSRKVLAVMPVVCKCPSQPPTPPSPPLTPPKKKDWVGTNLIIKDDDYIGDTSFTEYATVEGT